jgi:hypothetical protein
MADTGARLNILTHMSLGIVGCPPAQYFKDAAAEVRKHLTSSSVSVEEAGLLLESFEKEAIKKIEVHTAKALTRRLLTFFSWGMHEISVADTERHEANGWFSCLVFENPLFQILAQGLAIRGIWSRSSAHSHLVFGVYSVLLC